MNADRLSANSLHNTISALQIKLTKQKQETENAKKEAEAQKQVNIDQYKSQCETIVQKP